MAISIFALLESVMLARALFVAAELNIAEHLASRAMNVNEIAVVTQTNPNALTRLLYFLELNEVFKKQTDGCYCLTDFSQTMRASHPQTIRPFLLHDDETRWNSFGNLGYSITTGKSSFDMLYGQDYFAHIKQFPKLSERFNNAMTIISSGEDTLIAKSLSFYGTVADIGGGVGQLITQIAQNNSIEKGILVDLPEVVEQANNLSLMCVKQPGSFFEPLLIKADIFILKRILHDWDDSQATNILQNVYNAMQDNSKLYIIDGILDYSQDRKLLAAIDLALLTIFQGKERNKAEFENIIQVAGLKIVSIQALNNLVCVIECQK